MPFVSPSVEFVFPVAITFLDFASELVIVVPFDLRQIVIGKLPHSPLRPYQPWGINIFSIFLRYDKAAID